MVSIVRDVSVDYCTHSTGSRRDPPNLLMLQMVLGVPLLRERLKLLKIEKNPYARHMLMAHAARATVLYGVA